MGTKILSCTYSGEKNVIAIKRKAIILIPMAVYQMTFEKILKKYKNELLFVFFTPFSPF